MILIFFKKDKCPSQELVIYQVKSQVISSFDIVDQVFANVEDTILNISKATQFFFSSALYAYRNVKSPNPNPTLMR